MRRLIGLLLVVAFLSVCACRPRRATTPAGEATRQQPLPATQSPAQVTPTGQGEGDAYSARRLRLVERGIVALGVKDPAVIKAMQTVPRHKFVLPEYLDLAYVNDPLPIGYGQTISQPYIVALMTEALGLEADDRVLEIGTGSGYQAAVLGEIVAQVYTVEIIGALAEQAAARLAALGYDNVEVKLDDGYFGWEEHAPFDAVIVTAAPDHVPPPLRMQLADGGRLVIPVGPVGGYQELWLIERQGDEFTTRSLGGVVFVPLTRQMRNE